MEFLVLMFFVLGIVSAPVWLFVLGLVWVFRRDRKAMQNEYPYYLRRM